ncbi:MAG: hypothetical protein NE334_12290 [Lentisphaeraceae bacterium]|nr:hypothetical protein [Lentisphaeraceae bacterium]
MKYLLVVALVILTSCAGTTARTFNELNNGMSQEVTMEKLGKASSVLQKDDMEMHTYTNLYGMRRDHCNTCTKTVAKCDYFVVYKNGTLIEFGPTHFRATPNPSVTQAFFSERTK